MRVSRFVSIDLGVMALCVAALQGAAAVPVSALGCFALANLHYGKVRNGVGVFGLLLFLALFELS